MPFTLRNIMEDLEDVGSAFDGAPGLEFRMATQALELEHPQGAAITHRVRRRPVPPGGLTHSSIRAFALAGTLAVALAAAAPPAAAAPIVCSPAALVSAIVTANADPDPSTIDLAAGCTYSYTTPFRGYVPYTSTNYGYWYGPAALPAIASRITIAGNGATIERAADATQPFRLIFVGADPTSPNTWNYATPGFGILSLRNLTLRNGLARGGSSGRGGGGAGLGGAIYNQGLLDLFGIAATGNRAVGGATHVFETNPDGSGGGGGGIGADSVGTFGGGMGGDGKSCSAIVQVCGTFPGTSKGGLEGGSRYSGGGGGFRPTENGGPRYSGAGGGPGTGLAGNGGASMYRGQSATQYRGGHAGNGGGGGGYQALDGDLPGGDFGSGGFGGLGETPYRTTEAGGGGGVGGGGGAGQTRRSNFPCRCDTEFGGGGGGFGGGGGSAFNGLHGGSGGFGGGGGFSVGKEGNGGFGGGEPRSNSDGYSGAGAGMGGVIFNQQGRVTITNSTLAGNSAAGGSPAPADGIAVEKGKGLGGAVFNLNGTIHLDFDTIATNHASDDGSGIYNLGYMGSDTGAPAGHTYSAVTDVQHTIVYDAGAHDVVSNSPATVAGGHANTAASHVILGSHDIVHSSGASGSAAVAGAPLTSNPWLGPLSANGGDTPTMGITGASPAYNAIPAAVCLGPSRIGSSTAGAGCCSRPIDQRGVTRPQFGACDIGAFELDTPRTLSVSKSGYGSGTVTSEPAGIDCGGTCSAAFAHGGSVTLTAHHAPGSVFDRWHGACSGSSLTCTVTMDQPHDVGAAFGAVTATPGNGAPATPGNGAPATPGNGAPATPGNGAPVSKAGGTLTLGAGKRVVLKSRAVRLAGQLRTPTDRSCEQGRTVQIQRRRNTQDNGKLATFMTTRTDARGHYSAKIKIRRTLVYRAVVEENASCAGVTSRTRGVRVRQEGRR